MKKSCIVICLLTCLGSTYSSSQEKDQLVLTTDQFKIVADVMMGSYDEVLKAATDQLINFPTREDFSDLKKDIRYDISGFKSSMWWILGISLPAIFAILAYYLKLILSIKAEIGDIKQILAVNKIS